MIRLLLSALCAAAALAALSPPSLAQARTAKDCEAIQNPMEFNLCLASLSPVRGSRTRVAPPPEADEPAPTAARSAAPRGRARARAGGGMRGGGGAGYFYESGQRFFRYPGGAVVSSPTRGRKQMSFDIRRR